WSRPIVAPCSLSASASTNRATPRAIWLPVCCWEKNRPTLPLSNWLSPGVRERFGRPARVAFVQLVEGPTLDAAAEGVVAGLTAARLKAGVDYELHKYNAQGDLSQLPLILANVK